MLRGFWQLLRVELRIFLREPLGVLSTIGAPLIVFLLLGRSVGARIDRSPSVETFVRTGLPVFAALLIAFSAATSLVAIISIYREAGILKRLRATPLQPVTILGAHVFLKLALTGATLLLLVVAGKRFYPVDLAPDLPSFTAALLLATLSILAIGFVVASAVPTARFAQPVVSALLYPLLAISGLFTPIEALPPFWQAAAMLSPVTHAVSLLEGTWAGQPWSAYWLEIGVLSANLLLSTALAARIFRWE